MHLLFNFNLYFEILHFVNVDRIIFRNFFYLRHQQKQNQKLTYVIFSTLNSENLNAKYIKYFLSFNKTNKYDLKYQLFC